MNLKTKIIIIVGAIVLVVFTFYFGRFGDGLSHKNDDWGTFGDYIGGILNPVIAACALYLIAETYVLQKKELEATRELLKVSTDAQIRQVKLTALGAILDAKYTQKSFFSDIAQSLVSSIEKAHQNKDENTINELLKKMEKEINPNLAQLSLEISKLEEQIREIGGL